MKNLLIIIVISISFVSLLNTNAQIIGLTEPSYIIVAPKVVRPSEKIRISCTIFNKLWNNVNVKALIYTKYDEIASGYQELTPLIPSIITMKMPSNIGQDEYYLKVYGKLDSGELVFSNETILIYDQKAVSLIIQLEKVDFRHEGLVRFRCISFYQDMSPFFGTMDVFIYGPDGIILRRWENEQTLAGVVSKEFQINDGPPPGRWSIKAIVLGYESIKEFDVYEFYQWKFEVNVSMPHYFLTSSPGISGVVVANYTTGRAVLGKCRIKAYVKNYSLPITDLEGLPFLEIYYELFDGVVDYFFSMPELLSISGMESLNEMEVYVEAQVEDPFFSDLSNGSFITTLYDPKIEIEFMGKQPRAFKPKMPYTTYISVFQQDGKPLDENQKKDSAVRIKIEINDGQSLAEQVYLSIGSDSIASYTFVPDEDTEFIKITASFISNLGNLTIEEEDNYIVERAIRYKSPSKSYIQVTSSTINPQVGDYMIFTVKLNQYAENVYYHIVSSSRILFTNSLKMMNSRQKTFDVGLTREMAPSAHIVVYFIRDDNGELVSDSYNFHVNISKCQNKINMTLNRRKDFTGDTIEILSYSSPQSFIGFSASEESNYRLYNGGNIITNWHIYDELYSFDKFSNISFTKTWNNELGFTDSQVFYPSQSYAFDTETTFSYAGLIIFTDLPIINGLNQECKNNNDKNNSLETYKCFNGIDCFTIDQKCDGKCDCSKDCVDETNCPEKEKKFQRPMNERFYPKIERIYQLNWLWHDAFTLPDDGRVQFYVDVPKGIANYVVNAFAISLTHGFGILESPLRISTTRQFYIQVEAPDQARIGEQIGICVDAFNFQKMRIEALIILHPSEDYRFVNVEKDGIVSTYSPKTTSGYHQVLLIIQPGKSRRIHLPIVFHRKGSMDVTIEALSASNREKIVKTISVSPEGVINDYHYPFLLSLANKPKMMFEFELPVNESFILPLAQTWQYVPGSPQAQILITGDVCGPFFFLGYDKRPNADDYLMATNAALEDGIFTFGTLTYNLWYMRQGHGSKSFDNESYKKIINMLIYEMLRMQCNYEADGYFTEYGIPGTESIWLTSWAITVIKDGMDPQWERDGLFVDPNIINQTVLWLVSKQDPVNGSWSEIGPIYDRRFKSNFTKHWDGSLIQLNLALTAKVLIALVANSDVRGEATSLVSVAINKARFYLEQHFSKITDIFERCIVTYALHVSNSAIKDIAFKLLNQTRIKDDNGIYWSNQIIPKAKIFWPSKNPRQYWKPESNHEAYAVTATSYALLTYIFRAEKANKFEIVSWLITQKNYFAGMTSTYDSLIAHKALVLYAISTGDSFQNYNINIKLKSSSSDDLTKQSFIVNDNNLIEPQYYDLDNIWGSVELDAQGTGYALVQLSLSYNVEYPYLMRKGAYEAFNMSVQTRLSGRNFSRIDYDVCLSWLPENIEILNSNRSGHVQFEIEIPTGYRCENRALKSLSIRNYGTGEVASGPRVNFMFDYLDPEPTCFSFTIERYIPVANLTRYYYMEVYEYLEPGNSNRGLYYLRDVNALDICEVCGSYQCPYCPYYAFSIKQFRLKSIIYLILICFGLNILLFRIFLII